MDKRIHKIKNGAITDYWFTIKEYYDDSEFAEDDEIVDIWVLLHQTPKENAWVDSHLKRKIKELEININSNDVEFNAPCNKVKLILKTGETVDLSLT
jgi:hypothetical protein